MYCYQSNRSKQSHTHNRYIKRFEDVTGDVCLKVKEKIYQAKVVHHFMVIPFIYDEEILLILFGMD